MLPCFARRTSPEAAAIHGTDIEVLDVRSQPQRIKEVSSVVGRAFAGRHSKSRSRAQLALGTRASSPQLPLGDPLRVEFLTFFMGVGVLHCNTAIHAAASYFATRDAQSKVDRQGPTCGR